MSTPEPRPIRIGNEERERAVRALGDHFSHGRLEPDEFEDRCSKAYAARTADELSALFDDLPRPPAPAPPAVPPAHDLAAPFGREPVTGLPYSDKSKVVAGLLQIIFPFGTGRFYTGHTGIAIAQLLLVFVGAGVIWAFIDGIVLLASRSTDRYGRLLRS